MSIGTELQDGIAELETQLGADSVGVWRGLTVPCVPNRLKRGTTVVLGAKEETIQLSVVISATDLPTPLTAGGAPVTASDDISTATAATAPPSSGHKFQFQAVNYRIVSVSAGPGRAFYELDLADVNR